MIYGFIKGGFDKDKGQAIKKPAFIFLFYPLQWYAFIF